MKKVIFLIILSISVLAITSCGVASSQKTSNSLNEIQNIVRETQAAFENNNYQETQNGISKLIEISENPLYSENERLIAQYCSTYINAGVMLDYIIKNDNQWLATHNIDEFNMIYSGIFVEVINGQITHNETLNEYFTGLVRSTREIYSRYNELIGK